MSDSEDREAPDGTAPWDEPGKFITGISTEAFTAATGLWDGLMEAPRGERVELLAKFFDKFAAEEREACAQLAEDPSLPCLGLAARIRARGKRSTESQEGAQ